MWASGNEVTAMPLFPAFLDLSDAAVLVVGEGREADRKTEKMAPFCRRVLRSPYPPDFDECPALVILAEKTIRTTKPWRPASGKPTSR